MNRSKVTKRQIELIKMDTQKLNTLLNEKGFHIFEIEDEGDCFNIVFGDYNQVKGMFQRILVKNKDFCDFLTTESFIHSHFFEDRDTGMIVDVTHVSFSVKQYPLTHFPAPNRSPNI